MCAREVLDSWKAISAYLKRDIRTCRRWEDRLGLPVHRLNGSPKARVLAYKDEIDRWLETKLHEREIAKPSLLQLLRRWPAAAVFFGLFALAVLGWRTLNVSRPHFFAAGGHPALAVLPFVNGTGDRGLNYLQESVPNHLIINMQRSADYMTVFSFEVVRDAIRGLGLEPGAPLTPDDMAAVASRTGASWLLAGYLARSGSKLRIDYELREARAAAPLKVDRVPGTEAEMPVMEDRVSDAVRRVFGVPTASSPQAAPVCSVQATRYYELARAIERKYTLTESPADLDRMFGLFEQARDADPGCALAFLGLGDAYQFRYVYEGLAPGSIQSMYENYRRAYDMAPELAETSTGMAWTFFFRRDNDQAYAYIRRSIELDPANLFVLTSAGSFLASVGVLEQSTNLYSRVIRAGGGTADVYWLRAWSYEQMGLYEAALSDYDKMIELEPAECLPRCLRARVLVLMKRLDAAAADLAMAETLDPGEKSIGLVRALAAAARGDKKTALAALAPSKVPGKPSLNTYYRSRIYAILGMRDQAIDEIERAITKSFDDVQDYTYFFPFLNNRRDYFYDKLRGDPRFVEIVRREEQKYAERLEKYSAF